MKPAELQLKRSERISTKIFLEQRVTNFLNEYLLIIKIEKK
jgi:hypothetical protein